MANTDIIYLALIAAGLSLDHFVLWRSFLRRYAEGAWRARRWLWMSWMCVLWGLTGFGIWLWMAHGRDWGALRLVVPHGWRLWVAIGLAALLVLMQMPPILRYAGSRRPKRVRFGNPAVERLVPRTGAELVWWVAVSLTAGFCEEFIFRGYLISIFTPLITLWGAAAFSVCIFALGHAYQDARGVVATGVIGAILTLIVLGLGSLWPAIVVHALMDIGQGVTAWLALRGRPTEPAG